MAEIFRTLPEADAPCVFLCLVGIPASFLDAEFTRGKSRRSFIFCPGITWESARGDSLEAYGFSSHEIAQLFVAGFGSALLCSCRGPQMRLFEACEMGQGLSFTQICGWIWKLARDRQVTRFSLDNGDDGLPPQKGHSPHGRSGKTGLLMPHFGWSGQGSGL